MDIVEEEGFLKLDEKREELFFPPPPVEIEAVICK